MRPPIGISLFNLIMQYDGDSRMPKTFEKLKSFEGDCRKQGFPDLADYIKSWCLYIDYQKKAEWNVTES